MYCQQPNNFQHKTTTTTNKKKKIPEYSYICPLCLADYKKEKEAEENAQKLFVAEQLLKYKKETKTTDNPDDPEQERRLMEQYSMSPTTETVVSAEGDQITIHHAREEPIRKSKTKLRDFFVAEFGIYFVHFFYPFFFSLLCFVNSPKVLLLLLSLFVSLCLSISHLENYIYTHTYYTFITDTVFLYIVVTLFWSCESLSLNVFVIVKQLFNIINGIVVVCCYSC